MYADIESWMATKLSTHARVETQNSKFNLWKYLHEHSLKRLALEANTNNQLRFTAHQSCVYFCCVSLFTFELFISGIQYEY